MPPAPTDKIPLCDVRLSARTVKQVNEVLRSGWLSPGPKVAAFEEAVCEYLGVPNAVAVNSCTTGLQLALMALEMRPGSEVITTPFTFVATVEAITQAGATPVFADIEADTLQLDAATAERAVGHRTAAVIPVDIAGHPADYESLAKLCRRHALSLISDSAHAFGATYRGRPLTDWTGATVYSLYATKNLTSAEGGIVITRRRKLADRVRLLSRHGMTTNAYQRRLATPVGYDVTAAGVKGNLSEVHAAIGMGQLAVFDAEQRQRLKLVRRYQRNLAPLTPYLSLPRTAPEVDPTWHLFVIRLNLPRLAVSRDRFVELMAQRGIECGVHYRPVFRLSFYRRELGLSAKDFPNAAKAGNSVVSLPLYPRLRAAQVDYVCETIEQLVQRHRR